MTSHDDIEALRRLIDGLTETPPPDFALALHAGIARLRYGSRHGRSRLPDHRLPADRQPCQRCCGEPAAGSMAHRSSEAAGRRDDMTAELSREAATG